MHPPRALPLPPPPIPHCRCSNEQVNLKDQEESVITETIKLVFAFCFVWAIGGNVDQKSQEKFDAFCRDKLEAVVLFPPFGMVYDFQMNIPDRKLMTWETTVPDFKYNPKVPARALCTGPGTGSGAVCDAGPLLRGGLFPFPSSP